MADVDSKTDVPQDIVAIFHTSFHPTQGNIVDWFLKASDGLRLDGVEFSSLPSGLHLIDEDVVYFTKDNRRGVSVFRRRRTSEEGHRGFRLSSLGILLAPSPRPRPWNHVPALKALVSQIYDSLDERDILEPMQEDWEPAQAFFEERKARQQPDASGSMDWKHWNDELCVEEIASLSSHPTLHLPHLLRILGPSCLTLYKHILGRRRILIYTLPPVEAACVLCQVAADICYEDQIDSDTLLDISSDLIGTDPLLTRLKGKHKEGVNVLGMVTLHDIDMMERESKTGRGWIACTTDAIFMERPQYYDLIVDLTANSAAKAARPSMYISRQQHSGPRRPSYHISSVRFTWSDLRLWTELNRILQLDKDSTSLHHGQAGTSIHPPSAWNEVWRIYEDVCIMCAGLWTGVWRSTASGDVHLEGDDDLTLRTIRVRSIGNGIEGRPMPGAFRDVAPSNKTMRRSSGMSMNSSASKGARSAVVSVSPVAEDDEDNIADEATDADTTRDAARDRQLLTTLALLQTFHAHTGFLLSRLAMFLPPPEERERVGTVVLAPKDLAAFELGGLSGLDAKFVEWLADEYAGGAQVVVRRSWRDILGLVFGFGGM